VQLPIKARSNIA